MTTVRFVVLNLRMGGQVSSVLSLCEELHSRGVDASLLLPPTVEAASKDQLTAFGAQPFSRRMSAMRRLLGGLGSLAGEPEQVLHIVLPSPAFLPLVRLVPFPLARTVVSYEGPCTGLDREHLHAFLDDPRLMLPRLVLNNRAWVRGGPVRHATHVATHPFIARQLRRAGARTVHEIPNVSTLSRDEASQGITPLPGREPGSIMCAYVGHTHPVKGIFDLLAAFAHAVPKRPELRLLLALSADGDAEKVAEQVERLGISDRVTRLGLVDVRHVLERVDALVLPYRSAITTTLYPSLLLEAAGAGCPLILSRLPALESAVAYDSPSVHPVRPRSVASLTQALLSLPPRLATRRDPFLLLPPVEERVEAMMRVYSRVAGRVSEGVR